MRRLWHRITFGQKIMLLLLASGGTAALVACVLLVPVQYLQLRGFVVTQAQSKAGVIAVNSAAAISFNDTEDGNEMLAALQVARSVAAAALYTPDGGLFAQYRRADEAGPLPLPRADPVALVSGRAIITQPVEYQGRRLGTLVLSYDLRGVQAALVRNVLLAILAVALAVAAAVVAGLQVRRSLTQPVAELAGVARRVARTGDYSARARRFSDDELGQFTSGFNQMLGQIEAQAGQIRDTNVELRQRNQEMEQFVYTVSHDLKSPLVTITGFVGLLKQDIEAGRKADVLDSADHLEKAAWKMSDLIDDLLQLSRIGRVANEVTTVDVDALVAELAEDLAPRMEEAGARLVVERPLPPAVADRNRLAQVFDNLLGNALKYGATGSDPVIRVAGQRTGNEVRYVVRDNGPGIAAEYHERIFGLFQRLDNHQEGTGVGLAIVSRIIESHGGRVWVESAPGEGAAFWIAIPTAAPAPGSLSPDRGTPGTPETFEPDRSAEPVR